MKRSLARWILVGLVLAACSSEEDSPGPAASGSGGAAGSGGAGGKSGSSGQGGAGAAGNTSQGGASGAGASGASGQGGIGGAGASGQGGVDAGGAAGAGVAGSSGSSGQAGSSGAGGAGAGGTAGAGGGPSCEDCAFGVCIAGQCCDAAQACGGECCADGVVCSFEKCVVPGAECQGSEDCPEDQYCDPQLGGGEVPVGCAVQVAPGRCLPRPPVCPGGALPDPSKPIECVGKCEVKPATIFDPVVRYAWGGETTPPYATDVMMTPLVIQLDDDNCNGIIDAEDTPEILVTTFANGAWPKPGILHALAIDPGGTLKEKWSFAGVVAGAQLAGGNIDGQPGNEIVACGGELNDTVFAIQGATGQLLWQTKAGCYIPQLADLDQDGQPEVIVEGGILNGKDGTLKAAYATPPRSSLTVADLDGDGKLDVLSGFEAYRGDGSLLLDTEGQIAGVGVSAGLSFPNVVDLDKDGIPEVVAEIFASNTVAIWRYDAAQEKKFKMVRAPFQALLAPPGPWSWTNGLGPITAGDFNGDGTPDLGFVAFRGYVALDGKKLVDPSVASTLDALALWQKFTDEDNGSTGSAVFDFDGNGKVEVVYGDSSKIHIYDGATGDVLFEACNTDGTLLEYPVVADVDNDGHADLVVVSNSFSNNDGSNPAAPSYTCTSNGQKVLNSGVRVFSSQSNSWVRTRRIWNQHSYHVTNVNEDGSIPAVELPNWKQPGLNNYRQNKQPGSEFAAPDAIVSLGQPRCTSGPFALTAIVRNIGEAVLAPGGTVSFFEGEPTTGKLLGTAPTTLLLYPAQSEIVSLELPGGEATFGQGQGQVSVTVSGPWVECQTDNNKTESGYAVCGKL